MKKRQLIVPGLVIAFLTMAAFTATSLQAEPKKKKGWLGVAIQTVTQRVVDDWELKVDEGALVTDVTRKSPAYEAGIKEGDVIVEYEGRKVEDSNDLMRFVSRTPPNEKVKIKVNRNGDTKELEATIEGRSSRIITMSRGNGNSFIMFNSDEEIVWLGVDLEDLTDQLREYFGAEEYEGVLVVNVQEESPAKSAGLKGGDVITKVGKRQIEDSDDLRKAIRRHEPGDEVEIEYIRRGKRKKVKVKLEERDNEFFFRGDFPEIEINLEGLRGLGSLYDFRGGRSGLLHQNLENLIIDIKGGARNLEHIFEDMDIRFNGRMLHDLELEMEHLDRGLEHNLERENDQIERELEHKFEMLNRRLERKNERLIRLNERVGNSQRQTSSHYWL